MKRVKIYLLLIITTILFNGCFSLHNPFSIRSAIEIKEGYLSLKSINMNLAKQIPIKEKIGNNEINIVSVTLFASKDSKSLVVELEFIFKSFEIPEGLPAVARTKAAIEYNPKTRDFKLSRIKPIEIRYLKESLLEYITPQQKKFIPKTLTLKLYSLILHKSKKVLGSMKSFEVKEGKIKVIFR